MSGDDGRIGSASYDSGIWLCTGMALPSIVEGGAAVAAGLDRFFFDRSSRGSRAISAPADSA
jgi:hypothetical protein